MCRTLLAGIVPRQCSQDLSKSIDELVQSGIFECAIAAAAKKLADPGMLSDVDDDKLCCQCMASEKHDNHMPCNLLRFTHTYLQETSYGLMVTDQRKCLHKKAAELLEAQAHKCRYCGGGDFMEGSEEHHHAIQVQQVFVHQLGSVGLQCEPRQRAFVGQVGAKRVQRYRRFSTSKFALVSVCTAMTLCCCCHRVVCFWQLGSVIQRSFVVVRVVVSERTVPGIGT